ncbi:MAG: phosphatidylserine decarboxylase [Lentisphaeria bacterium]|jgi:phosphatidylserine decarboxylase
MPPSDPILVIDRRTGQKQAETVLGDRLLRLACTPAVAPLARWLLFRSPLPSRLLGWYADSRWSRHKIAPTIRGLGIEMDDFLLPAGGYQSFNDFFCRQLKPGRRPHDPSPAAVAAPADCRLSVQPTLQADTCFPIKGVPFTVGALLGSAPAAQAAAAQFTGGVLMIARLCPADYHRYHFPFDGDTTQSWVVPGGYESVNPLPLARGARPFTGNWRQVSLLAHQALGEVAFIEVGAFGVGAVFNTHPGGPFRKMAEKGYFAFGGSTIVLLFRPGVLDPAPDLVANSAAGFETRLRAGETIATLR